MKKKALSVILLFVSLGCYAHGNNPFADTAKTDSSSKTCILKIYGKPTPRGEGEDQLSVKLTKMNKFFIITLELQTGATTIFTVRNNNITRLRMADSTIISLHNGQNVSSAYNGLGSGSYIELSYLLSPSDMAGLSTQLLKLIKFEYAEGSFKYVINAKEARGLKAMCYSLSQ